MDKYIFSRLRTQLRMNDFYTHLRTHITSQLHVLQRCLCASYARTVSHTTSQTGEVALVLSLFAIIVSLIGITIGSAVVRHTQTPTTRADAFPYESILEVRDEQGAVITWQDGMRWETTVAGDTNRGDIKDPNKPEARLTWITSAVPTAMQNTTATVSVTLPGYTITGGFCEDRAGTTCTRARRDGAVWRNITLEKDAKITYGWVVKPISATPTSGVLPTAGPTTPSPVPTTPPATGTGSLEVTVTALNWPEVTRFRPSNHPANTQPSACVRPVSSGGELPRYLSTFTIKATCASGSCAIGDEYTAKAPKRTGYVVIDNLPVGEYTLTISDINNRGYSMLDTCKGVRWPVAAGVKNQNPTVILQNIQNGIYETYTTERICTQDGGSPNIIEGIAGIMCYNAKPPLPTAQPTVPQPTGGGGGSCGASCIYSQEEGSGTVCYQGNCLDESQNCRTNYNCGFVPGCSSGERVICPGHMPTSAPVPTGEVQTECEQAGGICTTNQQQCSNLNGTVDGRRGCSGVCCRVEEGGVNRQGWMTVSVKHDFECDREINDEEKTADSSIKNEFPFYLYGKDLSAPMYQNNANFHTAYRINTIVPLPGERYLLRLIIPDDSEFKVCPYISSNPKDAYIYYYSSDFRYKKDWKIPYYDQQIFVDLNDTATPPGPQSPEIDECKAEVIGNGPYRVLIVGDFAEKHGAYESFKEEAEKAIQGLKDTNINELNDNLSKIQFLIKRDPEDFGCPSDGNHCKEHEFAASLKTKCGVDNVLVLSDHYLSGYSISNWSIAFLYGDLAYHSARHEWGHSIARLSDEYLYDDLNNEVRDKILILLQKRPNCAPPEDSSCTKWTDIEAGLECYEGCTFSDWYRPSEHSIMRYETLTNTWNKPSLWQWNKVLSEHGFSASIDNNQLYHVVYTLKVNQPEENILHLQSLTAGTGYPVKNNADDLKSYYTIDILDVSGSVLHTQQEAKHSIRFGETVDISLKDTLTLYLPYYTTAQTIRIRDEQGQTVFTTPVKNDMYSVPEDTQNLCGNSFCDIANGEDAQSCRADCGPQVGKPESVRADLDNNGIVNALDLAILIDAYGTPDADIDGDSKTNAIDYSILLRWIGTEVREEE